ncbi:MAG: hypothetical protein ACI9SY_000383 [Candidatus Paceibacteria bacterium]|jgi:hypothetical protein
MDTLFLGLKKLLVGTIFLVFAFVMVYVPQAPTSDVPVVEAGGLGGLVYDPTNTAQNALTTVQETITAAASSADWTKNLTLDGIAWSLAKRAISMMASEFLNWVNSGFQGRPAFVTDLRGFLLDVADAEIGSIISDLGGIGSFICAPFRLDVQIAVSTQYQQGRDGEQSAPTCTLTGIIDNIEGFISGIDPGRGLADWLTITNTPQTYTPYGAVLSAQATARARLINAEGEEIKLLDYGSGFISQSVCEIIEGTDQENCQITTPGVTIANQVNKVLGVGQDILVEADEINEYIGTLLGALANQAIIGAAGLLGLSGGGASYGGGYDGSYLEALTSEADEQTNITNASETIADALRSERGYRSDNQFLLDTLTDFIVDETNSAGERNIATILNEEINNEVTRSNQNIITLTPFLAEYNEATTERRVEIFIEYSQLNLTNDVRKAQNLADWREQMSLIGINPLDNRGFDEIISNFEEEEARELAEEEARELEEDDGLEEEEDDGLEES